MTEKKADLFSPVKIGPYELPNRIVMSPMTRSRAGAGGIPTSLNARYYEQRVTASLIITEAAQVSLQGVGYPFTPGIHNSEQAEGWRGVTDAVHGRGGRIFCQLFHAGRISVPQLQPEGETPVAPSAVAPEGEAWTAEGMIPYGTPRALKRDEIDMQVEAFRRASEFAVEAGFDGVEIHSANGYLPDQFLQSGTNRREDGYGGPAEKRVRFVREVLDAVAGVWGAEKVGIHISPGNPFNSMRDADPAETFVTLVEAIGHLGLAYLHVSEINLADPGTATEANYNAGPNEVTGRLRELFRGPYISNGGYDGRSAERVLSSGWTDLVSFGRSFVGNPDLPERLRTGAGLNDLDPATLYGGGEQGYTDYPFLDEGNSVP
jgi:N-ethylmaleimide reductase